MSKSTSTKNATKEPKAAAVKKVATKPKTKIAKRYSAEQKKEIVDFVASYNAANGRGGQSRAAEKFNVSPLTIMAWLKSSGRKTKVKKSASKTAKSPTASISSAFDQKLAELLALSKEISKAEATLAQLHAKFAKMKASL